MDGDYTFLDNADQKLSYNRDEYLDTILPAYPAVPRLDVIETPVQMIPPIDWVPGSIINPALPYSTTCSQEQLRKAGYVPPSAILLGGHKDSNVHIRTAHDADGVTHTSLIQFRCLEPPPVPPSGHHASHHAIHPWDQKLTIIEERPPPLLAPKPEEKWIRTPPVKEPALILREQPPTPPPPRPPETCKVILPAPPAPPQQLITHKYKYPPQPRDIIVERWLPYKYSEKREVQVIRAPPYVPPVVRDVEITHIPAFVRINHQIQHLPGPVPTDPTVYVQQYGTRLLDIESLKRILYQELEGRSASPDILERIRAIFRVQCDQRL